MRQERDSTRGKLYIKSHTFLAPLDGIVEEGAWRLFGFAMYRAWTVLFTGMY
jgi:hypothetical protein